MIANRAKRSAVFIAVFAGALFVAVHLGISSLAEGKRRLVPSLLLFPYFLRLPPASWESSFHAPVPEPLRPAEKLFQEGFNRGNFMPAADGFRDALRREPDASWRSLAKWRIAEAYHRMGQYQEAETFWRQALLGLPTAHMVTKAEASLGECLYRMGRFREAMPLFQALAKRIAATRLEKGWALYRLGDILEELGFEDEAAARYSQANSYNISPKWIPLRSLGNIIQMAFNQRDVPRARYYLMTALTFHSEDPLRPRWLYLLSETDLAKGRDTEAALTLQMLIKDHDHAREKGMAQMRLATLRLSHPESPAFFASGLAPTTWEKASHPLYYQYPGDVLLHRAVLDLGVALFRNGDKELGIRVLLNGFLGFYESWVTRKIRRILLRETKAQIHDAAQRRDHRKTIRIFDAASAHLPETWRDPRVLMDAALSYEETGFYQISAAIYQRVRKRGAARSVYRGATLGLARSVLCLGNPGWALSLLNEGAEGRDWSRTARAILQWASTAEDLGTMRTAARWIRDAARGSLSLESALLLARFHMDRGCYQEGAVLLQEALEGQKPGPGAEKSTSEAYCLLGDGLYQAGRLEQAMASYLKALGRGGWGFYEKWAAYQAVRLGFEAGTPRKVQPYLEKLLKEPEGSFFRELARLFKNRMDPAREEEKVT